MQAKHIALIGVVAIGIALAVPLIAAFQADPNGPREEAKQHIVHNDLPTMLLKHPGNVKQQRTGQDAIVSMPSGFTGVPNTDNSLLAFEHVPPSETAHEEPGIEVYQLSGSDRVRVELYMGEQETSGHGVQISNVTQYGQTIQINAVFIPQIEATGATAPEYPADAVEFSVPDGNYTVHVKTMRFDHSTEELAVDS
jgi:hypothetical protein